MRPATLRLAAVLAGLVLTAADALAQQMYQSQTLACQFAASVNASAAAKLVSGVAGKQIYICGYVLNAGAAASTFQFQFGTGTNCGTGTTSIGPQYSLGTNGVLVDRAPYLNGMAAPAGNDLCVAPSAASAVTLYYTQF